MDSHDSTPNPKSSDFLQLLDPYGNAVLVHRLLVEQSAATGQAVLIPIPADACRAALTGPRQLTATEQGILDTLRNVGAPMTAPELSNIHEVAATVEHIKRLLQPGGHLRQTCGVKHQKGAGYFLE